jgi:hypothetical protein
MALLPSYLASARFGPTVSSTEARAMQEFGPNGRQPVFFEDPRQWLTSDLTGLDLRATEALTQVPILFAYLLVAAMLPRMFVRRLLAVKRISGESVILLQLLAASFGLFLLAHLVLFQLYYPARYVKWSIPLVLAVAAGLALGIVIETVAARIRPARRGLLIGGLALGLAVALLARPARYEIFAADEHPRITAYLRSQPKDILVAGLLEADSVPSFAERAVVASREHALPLHEGYYGAMRTRVEDLIQAYYAQSPGEVADFATRYGVDVFLVNRTAFQPETFKDPWTGRTKLRWEPFTSAVLGRLEKPGRFALLELAESCAVVDDGEVAVVPTNCLGAG